MRGGVPLLMACVALAACTACAAGDSPEDDTAWVGAITTEGNVTTVVNDWGSVWGGEAMLVEEASIGVGVGPEEYMLGEVASLYATDDSLSPDSADEILQPGLPTNRIDLLLSTGIRGFRPHPAAGNGSP